MYMALLQYGGGKGLGYYLEKGGYGIMIPLLILLIIGLVISLTRLFIIFKAKVNTSEFMGKVRSLLLEQKLILLQRIGVEICRPFGCQEIPAERFVDLCKPVR